MQTCELVVDYNALNMDVAAKELQVWLLPKDLLPRSTEEQHNFKVGT